MRIKLDENIPHRLVEPLTQLGHDVDTVQREGLTGSPDSPVWQAAQRAARFLVTQDLDFSDLRIYKPGTHHGLLLVRLAVPGREALFQRILQRGERRSHVLSFDSTNLGMRQWTVLQYATSVNEPAS
jgi:predicted nuclease of predicted toxin-antitoxin system